jgi:hypothetical protein
MNKVSFKLLAPITDGKKTVIVESDAIELNPPAIRLVWTWEVNEKGENVRPRNYMDIALPSIRTATDGSRFLQNGPLLVEDLSALGFEIP